MEKPEIIQKVVLDRNSLQIRILKLTLRLDGYGYGYGRCSQLKLRTCSNHHRYKYSSFRISLKQLTYNG